MSEGDAASDVTSPTLKFALESATSFKGVEEPLKLGTTRRLMKLDTETKVRVKGASDEINRARAFFAFR